MENVYEVTVEAKVRFKIRTTANSLNGAYDNVKTDFENDPQAFIEEYDNVVIEDSYEEVDAEIIDEC